MEVAIPSEVKTNSAGASLWKWLASQVEGLDECGPLAVELCVVMDRLQEVREKIASQGIIVSGTRGRSAKNPLLDIEIKLGKRFSELWKSLGLADRPADNSPLSPGQPRQTSWQD
jgi:hypothetical protein